MARRTRHRRYATCRAVTGKVVGLEKASEQHIEGSAFITGSQRVSGYYHGAHGYMTATGRTSPATGQLSGFGSLFGAASIRTRYAYETRFFMRQDDGVDRPFRFPGVEYLPILDGHTLSAIWCENDRGKPLLIALVNHNTQPAILPVATEDQIIDHLGIPTTRRVRRVLLSEEERDRLLDERQVEREVARQRRERVLNQKRETRVRYAPWLFLACAVSLTLFGFGAVLKLGAKNPAVGTLLLVVGILGLLAGGGALAYVYIDEAQAGRRPARREERIETHTTETVPNEEVDEELDRIEQFIAGVARSGRP